MKKVNVENIIPTYHTISGIHKSVLDIVWGNTRNMIYMVRPNYLVAIINDVRK